MTSEEFKSKLARVKWDKITAKITEKLKIGIIKEGEFNFYFEPYLTWNRDLMEYCRDHKILWINRDKFGFNPVVDNDIFWHELRKLNYSRDSILTTLFNNHTITILNGQNNPFKIKSVNGWEQHFKVFCEDNHLIWKNMKDWIPVRFEEEIFPNQILYEGEKDELFCRRLNQMVDNHFKIFPYAATTKDRDVVRFAASSADEKEMNLMVVGFMYGWDAKE